MAGMALVLLGTACSSGSGSGGSGGSKVGAEHFSASLASTTTEFRAKTTQIKAQGRTVLGSSDQGKVLAIYEGLRDATKDASARYHQLTPPSALSSGYTSFLKSIDEQVAALDDVVSAAKQRDAATVTRALRTYATSLAEWGADLARLSTATTTAQNG